MLKIWKSILKTSWNYLVNLPTGRFSDWFLIEHVLLSCAIASAKYVFMDLSTKIHAMILTHLAKLASIALYETAEGARTALPSWLGTWFPFNFRGILKLMSEQQFTFGPS